MTYTTSTIVCPECGRSFSLTDAVQAEVNQLLATRYDQEVAELKTATEAETRATVLEEVAVELAAAQEELGEFQSRARADRDELVALRRQLRGERTDRERAEVDFERRLLESQDAIRRQEREAAAEAHRLEGVGGCPPVAGGQGGGRSVSSARGSSGVAGPVTSPRPGPAGGNTGRGRCV